MHLFPLIRGASGEARGRNEQGESRLNHFRRAQRFCLVENENSLVMDGDDAWKVKQFLFSLLFKVLCIFVMVLSC